MAPAQEIEELEDGEIGDGGSEPVASPANGHGAAANGGALVAGDCGASGGANEAAGDEDGQLLASMPWEELLELLREQDGGGTSLHEGLDFNSVAKELEQCVQANGKSDLLSSWSWMSPCTTRPILSDMSAVEALRVWR